MNRPNHAPNKPMDQSKLNRTTSSEAKIPKSDAELLLSSDHKFVLFPIRFTAIFRIYKTALSHFWTPEQVDLTFEKSYFDRLRSHEKRSLKSILCATLVIDTSLAGKLAPELVPSETRCCLGYFLMTSNIHREMTSLLLEKIFDSDEEKDSYTATIKNLSASKQKLLWTKRWSDENSTTFGVRIAAFIVESFIFNSGRLVITRWLGQKGLTGLHNSGKLIHQDIRLYRAFGLELWNNTINKAPISTVLEMLIEAVNLESAALDQLMHKRVSLGPQSRLNEVTAGLLHKYIKHEADGLLKALGFEKHYHSADPFEFMQDKPLVLVDGYSNINTPLRAKSSNPADNEFSLTADF